MKPTREWATPLTTGVFTLMAVTGTLMFFHLDSGLNKLAHEWLGWLMIAAVGLHVAISWFGFKRYFSQRTARVILALSALVIAGSFAPLGRGPGGPPAPLRALQAVVNAPLSQVAPLSGRPVAQLIAELQAAGFAVQDAQQTLAAVVGRDREREGRALAIVLPGAAGPAAPR